MRLRTLRSARHLFVLVGLTAALTLCAADAWAKKTQVDFGLDNTPPTNNVNGESWTVQPTQCTSSATAPATFSTSHEAAVAWFPPAKPDEYTSSWVPAPHW